MWHSRFTLQSSSVFPAFEVADLHMSMMDSAGPTTYNFRVTGPSYSKDLIEQHCSPLSASENFSGNSPQIPMLIGCIPGQLNRNLLGWYPDVIFFFFKVPRREVKNKNKCILKHPQLRFIIDRSLNAF